MRAVRSRGGVLTIYKWSAPVAAATLLVASGVGCGRKVLRSSDVSSADYYTAEEFKHLSEEQRTEYCEELADEFQYQKERRDEAGRTRTHAIDEMRVARTRVEEIRDEIDALASDEGSRPVGPAAAGVHVVRRGDTLWGIAREVFGHGRRWTDIHDVNRDRVPDPDLIRVGMELRLPAAARQQDRIGDS